MNTLDQLIEAYIERFGDHPTIVTMTGEDAVAAIEEALRTGQPVPEPPSGDVAVFAEGMEAVWRREAQPIIATERPWYSPRRAWHTICKLLRGTTQ